MQHDTHTQAPFGHSGRLLHSLYSKTSSRLNYEFIDNKRDERNHEGRAHSRIDTVTTHTSNNSVLGLNYGRGGQQEGIVLKWYSSIKRRKI